MHKQILLDVICNLILNYKKCMPSVHIFNIFKNVGQKL